MPASGPRHPVLVLLVLLAFVGLGGGLAACGGDEAADDDVATILKDTFGSDEPVESGDLDLELTLDAEGLPNVAGPIALALTGPFDGQGDGELPSFDFSLALDAGGQAFSAGAVSTGEEGFLEFQGQAFKLDDAQFESLRTAYGQAQKEAGEERGEGERPTFSALGIDPLRWLTDAEKAGTEDVGGAETVKITGGIDVPRFLEDINTLLARAGDLGVAGADEVPSELSEEQRAQITEAVKSARVEVYSGNEDRLLRRAVVAITFDVPQDAREATGGLQSGELRLDFTISELNEDQEIEAPQDARPIAELTGGAPVAPADAGASGGASAPTAPAANPEYLQCVEAAGADLREVQKCADALAP